MDDTPEPGPVEGGPADRLAEVLSATGSVWTFLLMFLIVADVIGRSFLNSPIVGVAEIAGRSVVAIVFLQLAGAILSDRLTRADLLLQLIGARSLLLRRAMKVFFMLCAALVCGLIAFGGWGESLGTFTSNEFFGVQGVFTIPIWPFRWLMTLGAVFGMLAALLGAFRIATGARA
ncbi:TRAP transporter small permease subunit [Falsigemmobacter intermedius]|uniref:TRAP transporter small permease protein n=1 Tax=Falsigemmobacter intermedius TaxID=1553448 RepID=A0A444MBQ4_9RHOB|nr:TRAP transporter small permease [Falsigemmobacter intermedius]RWY41424.1 TRAP transporter small permease [Falsigemmobacter intermedius]